MSIKARRVAISIVLAFATLITGTPITMFAADTAKLWTTVGSAGTVDEDDLTISSTNDRNIQVSADQIPATLDVRYNIVAVDGLVPAANNTANSIFMKVRYRDQGSKGQIVLRLKKYDLNTGSTTTLLTFDSDAVPQSNAPQVRMVWTDPCPNVVKFDFVNNAYYIDAQLIQTGLANLAELPPLLAIIQVGIHTFDCGPG